MGSMGYAYIWYAYQAQMAAITPNHVVVEHVFTAFVTGFGKTVPNHHTCNSMYF